MKRASFEKMWINAMKETKKEE